MSEQSIDNGSIDLQPLAGSDYLQIAQFFHTVLIRNVPRLNLDTKSQARRFITMIDTLYDARVRVSVRFRARKCHEVMRAIHLRL